MALPEVVSIPVRGEIVAEMVRRGRPDVVNIVDHALQNFLDSTRGDGLVWTERHAEEVEEADSGDSSAAAGSPLRGYQWKSLFLPNGTRIKMTYYHRDYFAEVRQEKILYEGKPHSPSALASKIAAHTSRDAWRDLWVMRPGDTSWKLAGALRSQQT